MKKAGMILMMMAGAAFAGEYTGVVSEDHCGAQHKESSEAAVRCVTSCIKGGAKPVLVVDGKVVKFTNPEKVTEPFYGKKVTVTGDMKGETLTVASIAAAK